MGVRLHRTLHRVRARVCIGTPRLVPVADPAGDDMDRGLGFDAHRECFHIRRNFVVQGAPRAPLDKLLGVIKPRGSPPPVVSVDIPSGV